MPTRLDFSPALVSAGAVNRAGKGALVSGPEILRPGGAS